MSRLTIDVSDEQHQTLKAMAALQGKTIKQYALERLFPASTDEAQAIAELRTILGQRIAESGQDDVDHRTLSEIAEAELIAGRNA
jgi:uncharacterized protein (DUF1778 family)